MRQEKISDKLVTDVFPGFIAGIFCAGLLTPWDRALYLSTHHHRHFLNVKNFESPFQGFSLTILQRAFFGSIYYMMQHEMKTRLTPVLSQQKVNDSLIQMCIGATAGTANAIITNPVSAAKYYAWSHQGLSFRRMLSQFFLDGGLKVLYRGVGVTIARDMTFGVIYEVLRQGSKNYVLNTAHIKNQQQLDLLCNCPAAMVGATVAAPLNYARMVQYGMSYQHQVPSTMTILRRTVEVAVKRGMNPCRMFNLGWGSGRVAAGIVLGQMVFDAAHQRAMMIRR
jgi:hypothetical protein